MMDERQTDAEIRADILAVKKEIDKEQQEYFDAIEHLMETGLTTDGAGL